MMTNKQRKSEGMNESMNEVPSEWKNEKRNEVPSEWKSKGMNEIPSKLKYQTWTGHRSLFYLKF